MRGAKRNAVWVFVQCRRQAVWLGSLVVPVGKGEWGSDQGEGEACRLVRGDGAGLPQGFRGGDLAPR